jgi:hypothetical protein
MKKTTTCLAAAVLLFGCSQGPGSDSQLPTAVPTAAPGGALTVDELSDAAIRGSYVVDNETLTFDAKVAAANLVTVTMTLHGLTLDATLDTSNGNRMWTQDGFTTATGADTTLENEDRVFIDQFVRALEANYPSISSSGQLAFHFDTVINMWSQWVPAMALSQIKFEDKERAIDMCYWASDSCGNWGNGGAPCALNKFHNYDGHDCNACSGDPVQGQGFSACSSYAEYGNWYSGQTYYYWNGAWQTSSNGHGNGSYIIGDCFGRYGAGCGSGNAYFQENGSHDHCVRNAHSIVSSWCSDELLATTAPYNCY